MSYRKNEPDIPQGLDPLTRRFIEEVRASSGPPLHEIPIEQARAFMREMQTADLSGYAVDTLDIDVEGYSLHIVRPRDAHERLPAVMYFHGGGWVLGEVQTHGRLLREIAIGVHAAVVFVSYTLAPEAHYPKAVEECYAATRYVRDQADAFNIDSSRMAAVGDSSGGNLAAAVALMVARHCEPALRLQVLLYPVLDCDFSTPSYESFGEGFNLDRETMKWFWNHYAPDTSARMDPLACPLRAASSELSLLPPALIVTCEYDVLRDEGEAYARKLADAGVSVTAARFLGTVHGFAMVDSLAAAPAAISCLRLVVDSCRSALGR
jgi:acetyl esterase